MLKLFGQTDTYFNTNGDKVIKPLRAIIHKEDNGSFYLDLEVDLSYVDDVAKDRIIIANTPQGEQAFRIGNIEKTKHKIKAICKHVYYDSENYLIADSYVVEKNCNDALDHLNSATDNTSPFTTISDITTINSYRCVRRTLSEAIEVVLERWGGHLVRDNFNIGIRNSVGQDNGVTIRYAKNLKDITCEENWNDVVTKLLPVGKDGILLNELDDKQDIYVYSSVSYELPYTKTISFNQDHIEEDSYLDENGNLNENAYKSALIDDLRIQAQNYIDNYCIPKVNYSLSANLEKISDIGDAIEVIDERLNINILTNVIAYEYDCILEKYIELEFGNFQKKLSNLMRTISDTTEQSVTEAANTVQITLNRELNAATSQIWNALNGSYVIYDGDKILVVDTLPKESATNVIMINSNGIGFSNTGINGTFNSAWLIDGTLDMQAINVINLTANLIKGGTLKLGSNLNENGILELYDESNNLIGLMDKNGLKMFGLDGSYVLLNNEVGFAGYDKNNNKIFWADKDEFHMKKSVVEEEITLCAKARFIPITITDENDNIVNDGIGIVSVS